MPYTIEEKRERKKIADKKYREKNKEKIKQSSQEYYNVNKEKKKNIKMIEKN